MSSPVAIQQSHPVASPGGDPSKAFQEIYKQHFPFVWRCIRGLGVSESSLDDVAQDVFIVVHRRLENFRGESTVQTWLYGILRHIVSNHHRSRRRKPLHGEPLSGDLSFGGPGPAENAERGEAARFVQRFAARLNDKKRDVFVLGLLEGLAIPDVAAILHIGVNTAYSRLRTVRAEFDRAVARHRGET